MDVSPQWCGQDNSPDTVWNLGSQDRIGACQRRQFVLRADLTKRTAADPQSHIFFFYRVSATVNTVTVSPSSVTETWQTSPFFSTMPAALPPNS